MIIHHKFYCGTTISTHSDLKSLISLVTSTPLQAFDVADVMATGSCRTKSITIFVSDTAKPSPLGTKTILYSLENTRRIKTVNVNALDLRQTT